MCKSVRLFAISEVPLMNVIRICTLTNVKKHNLLHSCYYPPAPVAYIAPHAPATFVATVVITARKTTIGIIIVAGTYS